MGWVKVVRSFGSPKEFVSGQTDFLWAGEKFRKSLHGKLIELSLKNFVEFYEIFGGHKSFLWVHWYPCFGLLGFKARMGSLNHAWQKYMCYTLPGDSPLVRHLPTSWQTTWQPSHSLPQSEARQMLYRLSFDGSPEFVWDVCGLK